MKKYMKLLFVTLIVISSLVLVTTPAIADGGQEFNGSGAGEMNREIDEDEGDEGQGGDEEEVSDEKEISFSSYSVRFNLYTKFGWGSSDYLYDYEIDDWSNNINNSIVTHGFYGGTWYVFTIPGDTEISRHDGSHVSGVFFSGIDGDIITSTYSDMVFSNPVTVYIYEGDCYRDMYGNQTGGILTEIGSFTEIVDYTATIE